MFPATDEGKTSRVVTPLTGFLLLYALMYSAFRRLVAVSPFLGGGARHFTRIHRHAVRGGHRYSTCVGSDRRTTGGPISRFAPDAGHLALHSLESRSGWPDGEPGCLPEGNRKNMLEIVTSQRIPPVAARRYLLRRVITRSRP